jgi:hypothetical protein
MSTKEIKDEIQKLLDNVPDDVLKDLLKYLKRLKIKPMTKFNFHNA